jgi:hypothetical protein
MKATWLVVLGSLHLAASEAQAQLSYGRMQAHMNTPITQNPTKGFAPLIKAPGVIQPQTAVLDGEVVAN